jgi:hypothetical protein
MGDFATEAGFMAHPAMVPENCLSQAVSLLDGNFT